MFLSFLHFKASDLSKGARDPWHFLVHGHNFTTINLEVAWRRTRMLEHTVISPAVEEILKVYPGNRSRLLAVYNLALDVNYPHSVQSEFGPDIQASFRQYANKTFLPLIASGTNVFWIDGPPIGDVPINQK